MTLERSLITMEKTQKKVNLNLNSKKFERTCNCHKHKNQKLSDVAKHYLYHKPNPLMKWPVQSLKVEEKKQMARRKTIMEQISPFKLDSALSALRRPSQMSHVQIQSLQKSIGGLSSSYSSDSSSESSNLHRDRSIKPAIQEVKILDENNSDNEFIEKQND